MNQPHILLTGANGFVGRALSQELLDQSFVLSRVSRASGTMAAGREHQVETIDGNTDWAGMLASVDVVIHLAARVHVMNEELSDPLSAYRQTNVAGTLNLARQAAQAGVKRFIFISSIKVNGEQTTLGQPFTAEDIPAPEDAYGLSKWEAEQGLLTLAKDTGMEVVIIRPPLVYGPGVKGNFASMIKLVKAGLPLPLGAIENRRSLVSITNLTSLIIRCVEHPAAANQVFLVSDGEDVSTTALLRRLAQEAGVSARLIPLPAAWLSLALRVLGKKMMGQRILGSLQVDISKTQALLYWHPPLTLDQGLQQCFQARLSCDSIL